MANPNGEKEHIGAKMFQPSDYEDQSELSQALAETHEQISDVYSAGTIDGLQFLDGGRTFVSPKSANAHAPTE